MARPFALVGSAEQWITADRESTHVNDAGRLVLDWTEIAPADGEYFGPEPPEPGGLAFDSACRLYRAAPDAGVVERFPAVPEGRRGSPAEPVSLFYPVQAPVGGAFRPADPTRALDRPVAAAVDAGDRLFIAEAGANRLLVYDLWGRTLLRRVPLPRRPLDLAAHGERVLVLTESGDEVLAMTARGPVRTLPIEEPLDEPVSRLAIPGCGCWIVILVAAGTADAEVVQLREAPDGDAWREIGRVPAPFGRDLEFTSERELVIARRPGETFLRYDRDLRTMKAPMRARGYGGEGIVRMPDGRVGYRANGALHAAIAAPVRHATKGRATAQPLDGGEFQRVWGRIFVDACVPSGTAVRVACRTSDEESTEEAQPFQPEPGPMIRRPGGSEIPWAATRESRRPVTTFEAPVLAPPGRYLWVTVELVGGGRATPEVHAVRVETPGHEMMTKLPRIYSREPDAADFLRRYLAGPDDLLTSLGGLADARHVLLDPSAAPADALPWLASFVGLILDERWSERAKRTAVEEAAWLFRFRGTVPGLRRFLEIVLGTRVTLIEHFKLRGQGSALLGDTGEAFTTSVLGGGFRVGGQVGATDQPTPLDGSLEDAFATRAHRFTVMIPVRLDPERRAVVEWVLEMHRPAHTVYDICTVDSGLRVGRGAHVGLSSVIGATGGFRPLRLAGEGDGSTDSILGRGGIVGRPRPGTRVDSARIGAGSVAG